MNRALALIAAGEIEIDVRPFAALFGQKPLEQQIHAYRIDRGDAQRVADGAVGRRAAALHQNIFLFAEANNVPDDQKIAGQLEFLDQREFAVDLLARALICIAITRDATFVGAAAQKFDLRIAFCHRIRRKFVAQIVQ